MTSNGWSKSTKKPKQTKKVLTKKIGLMEDTEGRIVYKIANKLIPYKICVVLWDMWEKKMQYKTGLCCPRNRR